MADTVRPRRPAKPEVPWHATATAVRGGEGTVREPALPRPQAEPVHAREEPSWTEFGLRLRYWRRNGRLTQAQLGAALGYHHSHISKIEKGLREPPARLPQQADSALGTGGELAALWSALAARSVRAGHFTVPGDCLEPDPGGAVGTLHAAVVRHWPRALPADGLPCPLHRWTGCAPPPGQEVLDHDLRLPASTGPGVDAVHALTALLVSCHRIGEQGDFTGLREAAENALCTVRGWIDATDVRGSAPAPLLALAARWAVLAGRLRVSAGQSGLGSAWYGHGMRWAERAGDTVGRAVLLCELSVLARLEGDPPAVRGYARALAGIGDRRSWTASMAGLYEARAHAMAGHLLSAERQLTLARAGTEAPGGLELLQAPWLYGEAGAARFEAAGAAVLRDVSVRTGDRSAGARALPRARAALHRVPAELGPTRLLLALRLADAHACAGDPEAALAVLAPALPEALDSPRALVARELAGLHRHLLREWRELPQVREFGERFLERQLG